jgi:DNA-binding GntR family transcriptional regulator
MLLTEQPSPGHAAFHELDTKFHLITAKASGNPNLHDAIQRQRADFFVLANAVLLSTSIAELSTFGEEHGEIARAISQRDPVRAEAEMKAHLDRSHGQFAYALARATTRTDQRRPG